MRLLSLALIRLIPWISASVSTAVKMRVMESSPLPTSAPASSILNSLPVVVVATSQELHEEQQRQFSNHRMTAKQSRLYSQQLFFDTPAR